MDAKQAHQRTVHAIDAQVLKSGFRYASSGHKNRRSGELSGFPAFKLKMRVKIKRIYEKPSGTDGQRILVDRVWPRGVKKQQAGIDLWLKDIAPSTELRKWFGHDPAKWDEFRKRYRSELKRNRAAVARLRQELEKGPVTLVYSAKDEAHNQAVVIREYSALFR